MEKLCEFFWELIDTLWNVNSPKQCQTFPLSSELIDTLWNVNECACWKRDRQPGN